MSRYRVLSFAEIGTCPLHILSAEHWIPEHRTEECDPEKRAALAAFDERQKAERRAVGPRQRAEREAEAARIRRR